MDQKALEGLLSIVSTLGWNPQLREVVGADTNIFYDALVARNPERAYVIAQRSKDPVLLQAVTERIIQNAVGGTDLEVSIREMYLKQESPAVSESVIAPHSAPVSPYTYGKAPVSPYTYGKAPVSPYPYGKREFG